jgi:hypothetical protein
MWRISRIRNPWDRDVALKQALGVPAEVFTQAEKVLHWDQLTGPALPEPAGGVLPGRRASEEMR